MREVTGAVIATSLVLIAVFVPVAFLSGTTGRLYQQFSLTIAFSVGISAFNALTLSPALAALLAARRAASSASRCSAGSTAASTPRARTTAGRSGGCCAIAAGWARPSSAGLG